MGLAVNGDITRGFTSVRMRPMENRVRSLRQSKQQDDPRSAVQRPVGRGAGWVTRPVPPAGLSQLTQAWTVGRR